MSVSQILDRIDESQELGRSNVRPVTEERRHLMLFANSSEYKEGEAAFYRGLTTGNNPHPFLSPGYWRWQEGLLGNGRPREWQVNPEPYKENVMTESSHWPKNVQPIPLMSEVPR